MRRGLKPVAVPMETGVDVQPRARPPMRRGLKLPVTCATAVIDDKAKPRARPPMRRGLKRIATAPLAR